MLRRIYYTRRRWLLQLPTFSPTGAICITRHWYIRDLRSIIMTLKQNTANISEIKNVSNLPSVCHPSIFLLCLIVVWLLCAPLYLFSLVRSWSIKAFNRTMHNVFYTDAYWRHDTMLLLMIMIMAMMIWIWILLMVTMTIAIITTN